MSDVRMKSLKVLLFKVMKSEQSVQSHSTDQLHQLTTNKPTMERRVWALNSINDGRGDGQIPTNEA